MASTKKAGSWYRIGQIHAAPGGSTFTLRERDKINRLSEQQGNEKHTCPLEERI
jgi:hypothetical protein